MTRSDTNSSIRGNVEWPDALQTELQLAVNNGRVGQELLSETDDVRVWSLHLRPGERAGFHRHQLNYFWVAINPGKSLSHYGTGETRETSYAAGETRHFAFGPGEYMIHDLVNIGDTDLIFTTVELKKSANPPLPLT